MERHVDGLPLGKFIRKLSLAGKAHCLWCQCDINYGSNGCKALIQHCEKEKHRAQLSTRKTNYQLPGKH